MMTSDYLALADSAIAQTDLGRDPELAQAWIAEAQVAAIQAVAAAIDRLAGAVENLRSSS